MKRNGPIWYRLRGNRLDVGFLAVAEIHGNNLGVIHGGMIASFADFALGHAVWYAHIRTPIVTIHLDVNFVSAAMAGEWISCTPEIVMQARLVSFVRGDIMAGVCVVATTSGVWKPIRS